jgi:hypothetical protein
MSTYLKEDVSQCRRISGGNRYHVDVSCQCRRISGGNRYHVDVSCCQAAIGIMSTYHVVDVSPAHVDVSPAASVNPSPALPRLAHIDRSQLVLRTVDVEKLIDDDHSAQIGAVRSDLQDVSIASDHLVQHRVDEEAKEETRDEAGDDDDGKRPLRVRTDAG